MGDAENNSIQQLSYEVAVYREQLRLLQKEVERINSTTYDLSNASNTAENLKSEDILVQIGGGSYVRANVYSTKILVPVGANYLIEMESKEASVEIKKRIDATKNAIVKLNEEFEKIAAKLQESGSRLRNVQMQQSLNKRVDDNIGEDYV
ncbi:MAG: prefoldin subunit alpha [Candidatus Micrarchaeota archaeon]|nr:prefoldin subunit alpha [Candidatus Micrarchaeota archaeon]